MINHQFNNRYRWIDYSAWIYQTRISDIIRRYFRCLFRSMGWTAGGCQIDQNESMQK